LAQREYFRSAGIYAEPTPKSIAEALTSLRENYVNAVAAVTQHRELLAREWESLAAQAAERINALG
jgi:hypothetical protein